MSDAPTSSPSRLYVAAVVGFHISTALSVTIINKTQLNTIPAPVILLLCQSVMAVAFIFLGSILNLYTRPKLDINLIRRVSPLLAMKIIAQLSKTYCLLNVNASFYQIARGLLLPFTIMLSFAILQSSRPSLLALVGCTITTLGFLLGVSGEEVGQTTNAGIAWGVWSSFTTALESVLVKYLALEIGVLDLVYVTSLTTIPVYTIWTILNSELRQVAALGLTHPVMIRFGGQAFIAGSLNFALSAAAYLQIKVTSPTTHMISTAARGVLQSLLAVTFIPGERLTSSRVNSLAVILFGTLSYTIVKEMEKRVKVQKDALPFYTAVGQKDDDGRAEADEANVPLIQITAKGQK
ncbi:hypothetical protein PV05_02859 [Exophiala xenobiotica]|uniref:Sugar phosphate transporter domain-containing protein n=1 Tax=Exophiala xenobiotica TaxID=348802 RepID=A0A0D2C0S7_9EURO|nr:uncharacterized protein PV05_02859 [Exophiala xenobiotica]KIW58331.1 hypothetical protein PV05_02859 [Exophiala xenobiotica]